MEMNEQKPPLKIAKGEVATIKLEALRPFKEGENEWDGVKKKWFGYNLTKGSQDHVYFASEAVHKLIQEAQPEGEFTLELRSVNNKDGQLRSIWYLNGKNLWQYEDVPEEPIMERPQGDIEVNIKSQEGPTSSGDSWKNKVEERLEKLEKDVYSKTVKTDSDIPF